MKFTRLIFIGLLIYAPLSAVAGPLQWALEFPKTKFNQSTAPLSEIQFVGLHRDQIPAIFKPKFKSANSISDLGLLEPVLRLEVKGEVRGYPIRMLVWHELINDTIKGVPVLISYSPLCSSGVVFDRRLDNQVLSFSNTGLLRHYDTIMYDTATESWFQQYTGGAIVGRLSGKRLKPIASRIQSFEQFKAELPKAKIMIASDPKSHDYGKTPYVRMDSRIDTAAQFTYSIPDGVGPFDRVVVMGNQVWPLKHVRKFGRIETPNLVISWSAGMNSIHDTRWIPFGRDIGNVRVQSNSPEGWSDAVHDTPFAFAFAAFHPNGVWHVE